MIRTPVENALALLSAYVLEDDASLAEIATEVAESAPLDTILALVSVSGGAINSLAGESAPALVASHAAHWAAVELGAA